MRRPCFAGEDVGLASIADEEAGYSGYIHSNFPAPATGPFFSKSRRGNSYRSLSSFSSSSSSSYTSPRSARLFEETQHHPSHFLEACFLCKKPLGNNRDIFMYRGDTPFCSEECRQEQIEIDEAKEKNCWNLSSSMKAIRKEQQSKATPNKSRNYNVRTSTVAAA